MPVLRERMRGEPIMSETDIQNRILRLSAGDVRLFRNNVGQAWAGKSRRISQTGMAWLKAGDVVVSNARPLHAGLCEGSSDLIGWRTMTITPDMVGQQVAVFTAIEVKSDRGRPTPEQRAFVAAVRAMGGRAGVAWSEQDARDILDGGRGGGSDT